MLSNRTVNKSHSTIQREDSWLGPQLSGAEISAVFAVASAGFLMTAATPVLLGALVKEGRLTLAQLGQAATVENLALTLTVIAVSLLRHPSGLRWWGTAAATALAAANVASSVQTGAAFILMRGLSGIAEGILVWMIAAMNARARNPGRWSALFSVVQGLSALGCVIIVPATVMKMHGAPGGYLAYAAIVGICIPAALFLPRSFVALNHGTEGTVRSSKINVRVISVLLCFALFTMFCFGIWVYLEPLAVQAHYPDGVGAQANSLAVAGQLAGSLLAVVLTERMSYFRVLAVGYGILAGVVVVLLSVPAPWVFLAASGVFGFLMLFMVPFMMMLAADADPSRQAVVMSSGAMFLGSAAGPLLNSIVVREDARNCVIAAGICLLVSFGLAAAVRAVLGRSPAIVAT